MKLTEASKIAFSIHLKSKFCQFNCINESEMPVSRKYYLIYYDLSVVIFFYSFTPYILKCEILRIYQPLPWGKRRRFFKDDSCETLRHVFLYLDKTHG